MKKIVAISQSNEMLTRIDEIARTLHWSRSQVYSTAMNHYLTCPKGLSNITRVIRSLGPNFPSQELVPVQAQQGKIRRET